MHYRLARSLDRQPLYLDLLKTLDAHLASEAVMRADESRLGRAGRRLRSCATERRPG
jgi:hypothetical protein